MAETKAESKSLYSVGAPEIAKCRNKFSPEISDAIEKSSKAAFSVGALSEKIRQLIAVALSHTTQYGYCMAGHTKLAGRKGASDHEIIEAI